MISRVIERVVAKASIKTREKHNRSFSLPKFGNFRELLTKRRYR